MSVRLDEFPAEIPQKVLNVLGSIFKFITNLQIELPYETPASFFSVRGILRRL